MGRLYTEREEVEQQLAWVGRRIQQYKHACERTVAALDGHAAWRRCTVNGNVRLVFPGSGGEVSKEKEATTFTGAAGILEALDLKERLQKRLTELNAFFEGRKRR